MTVITEGPQQVRLRSVGMRQPSAVANLDHLRSAARSRARNVGEIDGIFRISGVDNGRAVRLVLTCQRIESGAGMVADVEDNPAVLRVGQRLVGASGLKVIVPKQLEIEAFIEARRP